MNNSETEVIQRNVDFGALLASARKTKNLTLEDINEHLKIPLHVLKGIEANDLDTLPAPTFTQGYIRAYARHLEISEDSVLEIYNRAVPHKLVADLKPRSKLQGEASSQSLIVKIITLLLIFAGLAAVIVGSYQYYQKKAGLMESERETKQQRFTGNSLDSPGKQPLEIRQNARLTDDGELIVEQSDPFEPMSDDSMSDETVSDSTDSSDDAELGNEEELESGKSAAAEAVAIERSEPVIAIEETGSRPAVADNENDIIEIVAEEGSWVSVSDADNHRLLYNTIPVGGRKVLIGRAPFSVSMGNAGSTRVLVNNVEVDISSYIRTNNTAKFKVSMQGQDAVFH